MLIARMPDGLSKLSRDSILVADLPRLFTTKTNWRGSLPRDLLCAFCRQHRLSEPDFTVICKSIESDQDLPGSCQTLSDTKSCLESTSKFSIVEKGGSNVVAIEYYGCEIKMFSKDDNLILEHTPVEYLMKQGDAIQNATLRVLSFLNLYFKQPNMSLGELSLLGVDWGIKCHSTCFLKEFSISQLMNKVQQSRLLLTENNLKSNHIDPLTDWTSLQKTELSIQGTACGSLPSNGFLVSISYSVFLVLEREDVPEILEKNDEFEFEIGTGAVISCIEEAILQMTVGQSVRFYMDLPQKELILAAAMNCEKVLSSLSSSECHLLFIGFPQLAPLCPLLLDRCCLEYSITLLRVTEPFEDRMEQAFFSPPLSKQRVEFALQHIKEISASSLIDFGCGSGSLLESLVDTPSSLEKIVGIDLSQKGLIRAAKVLNSKLEKLAAMMPKSMIKSVILYEGSITDFDSRLNGFDIGTCLEVIEHMEEDQACLFGDIALGLFRPRVLIVSTPNYEYNVILQRSNLTSQEKDKNEKAKPPLCKFRNHDHKFEWTREQFNHWATCLALKYNYNVEFGGVGGKDGVEPGYASQIAVFQEGQTSACHRFCSLGAHANALQDFVGMGSDFYHCLISA
ncbi:Small RNA 2'-O-methyltransferase, partial [Bienertia sinuspersici]